MDKEGARKRVAFLVAMGVGGYHSMQRSEWRVWHEDFIFGAGVVVLVFGMYLQDRLGAHSGIEPAAAVQGDSRRSLLIAKALQWLGILLLYAGVSVWIFGRSYHG